MSVSSVLSRHGRFAIVWLMTELRTLGQVVGGNVRRMRMEKHQTQDELAALLSLVAGPQWRRSQVASLESGRRQWVDVQLLDALSLVYNVPVTTWFEGADEVMIGPAPWGLRKAEQLRSLFSNKRPLLGTPFGKLHPGKPLYPTTGFLVDEAELHAAAQLQVAVEAVRHAAQLMWRRRLAEERDARLAKSQRNARGARGWVTRRELLPELKALFARYGEKNVRDANSLTELRRKKR